MLRNYFKIAFRNLLRTKTFSFINITGLVLGMSCCILICLWIYNEVSFDQFHKHKDYLYQAWNRGTFDNKLQCWNTVPTPLAPALKSDYAGIQNTCRTDSRWFVTTVGEKKLSTQALVVDPSFLSMFSFPLIKGNAATALKDVFSIVITEKMATKMFGSADPMDQIISINKDRFKVTGILKDLPLNSTFKFEYLLPWAYYIYLSGHENQSWTDNNINVFVQLTSHTTAAAVDQQIRDIIKKHTGSKEENEIFLHPLSKWHLYSKFENGVIAGGRIEIVRLFGIIATFILLIACINFMNLSTARSEKRAREVGIRKAVGARQQSLVFQFLLESLLLVTIAGVIAIIAVFFTLPVFNVLINQELVLPVTNRVFWTTLVGFILLTGLLAGSYPAFFLSSFHPAGIFRRNFKKGRGTVNHRKILVVLQFCIAITLIISTIVVVRQLQYARNRSAGYTGDLLLYHWNNPSLDKNFQSLKNELLSAGIATSVTRTASQLTEPFSSSTSVTWSGKDPNDNTDFERGAQDEGLIRTAGLKLLHGRDLDLAKFPADSTAAIINVSAMKAMGFTDPIGHVIHEFNTDYHIVGVFNDFIFGSPYEQTHPMVIFGPKNMFFSVIHMRLAPGGDVVKQVQGVEKLFAKYNPDYPFEYHFVNKDYEQKFQDMSIIARLTTFFAVLTVLISCLGLFGLASYMAEERIKEIGIRKVLGASVVRIIGLLTKDFLILVGIALLIAAPIAWYAMHEWLLQYAYRTMIEWWVFVMTGLLVIAISLLTTGYHACKAALMNPVKSLKAD
ncbi:ABC transporter permease [Chitinophaga sp.]|uniref:ABC transporter permease n=1 Tax=Chitinophaga sp. TaxID=1869181 RepID=UPI0031DC50FB